MPPPITASETITTESKASSTAPVATTTSPVKAQTVIEPAIRNKCNYCDFVSKTSEDLINHIGMVHILPVAICHLLVKHVARLQPSIALGLKKTHPAFMLMLAPATLSVASLHHLSHDIVTIWQCCKSLATIRPISNK